MNVLLFLKLQYHYLHFNSQRCGVFTIILEVTIVIKVVLFDFIWKV